jgi:hypothetical protein
MKYSSKDAEIDISDLRAAAVLVFVILNLAVLFIRLMSVWRYGALFPTTGGEPLVIYPVWKAVHHLPVYEWPLAFPFSLAMYNYLFYDTYALFLRLVGADGAGIMTWGRVFTPVFAILGAIAQWKLVQTHCNLRGARSALSFFFALGLWFCASIVRQWAITIRPDMAACALVMIALFLVVLKPRFGFAYAGVLFYLAWSFKQSEVLALVGVCLFLLFHRLWRDLSVLAAVFAVLTAATILLGTPNYRFNILVAPRLIAWSVMWALPIATKSLIANAYWILAPIALLLAAGKQRVDDTVRLLTTVLVVALVGGLAGMTKVGSWDHYLLEAFVAGSTLLQIAIFATPGRMLNALVLFGCVQPAIQLAATQSGPHQHLLGTVGIATAAQYSDAEAMRARLASMKKPIFTTDEIFSLPWISTGNLAPALVLDPLFHDATRASCQNGCVEGLLRKGEFPTVMLLSSGDVYQSSLSPNYKKVDEVRESDRMWSIYVLEPQTSSSDLPIRQ